MTEYIITVSAALALIGAGFAAYQLTRIWIQLGTPFAGDMGTVFTEHGLLIATWTMGFMFWVLLAQFDLFSSDTRSIIAAALAVLMTVIIWVFALRTHLFYRSIRRDHDGR